MRPGILFIVVGPSGAGKDTLMDGARKALADSGRFGFARRLITRPADAGGEDHEAINEEGFAALSAAGGLLVSWNAHGLHYGLRASLRDELAHGRHIVANGSRGVLETLAGAVPRLIIINVTASPEVLAARLASRGRETAEDIAARLARRPPQWPAGIETLVVENNGAVEEGIEHFLAAIDAATRRLVLKPVPIEAWRDNIAYLPRDSRLGVEDFDGPGKVDVAGPVDVEGNRRSIRARINVVEPDWLLEPHEIGLSREAFAQLGLPAGSEITLTRTPPQHSRDALRAKIQGAELGAADYAMLLRDIVEGRYPEGEISAFLVAATRSLSDAEVAALASVRAGFSTPLHWDEPIVVDKHSMGGIPGSRITLIVAPIVAAHGLAMPKTSSRAITSAAGTADAMEVLAKVDLTQDEVRRTVAQARACIAWNGQIGRAHV